MLLQIILLIYGGLSVTSQGYWRPDDVINPWSQSFLLASYLVSAFIGDELCFQKSIAS